MASKRPIQSSGDTPGKPKEKETTKERTYSSRKSLFVTQLNNDNPSQYSQWSTIELQGLVQYIALFHRSNGLYDWPTHKQTLFWEKCAEAVQEYSGQPLRSGILCPQ